MTSNRSLAIAFLILLLFGGGIAIYLLQPQFTPRGRVFISNATPKERDDETAKATPDRPRCAPSTMGTLDSEKAPVIEAAKAAPATTGKAQVRIEDLKADEILVRAKIRLKGGPTLSMFRQDEREVVSLLFEFLSHDDNPHAFDWDAGFDGLLETVVQRFELPLTEEGAQIDGQWSAFLGWDRVGALPILAPKLVGKVLDFGVLEFDIADVLGEGEFLVMGQATHASGLLVKNNSALRLSISQTNSSSENETELDSEGRFHMTLTAWDPAIKCKWSYAFGTEEFLPLKEPKLEGRVYDFGKIVISCAALEIRVTGWLDDAQRKQLTGATAELKTREQPSLYIGFYNYETYPDCSVARSDDVTYAFLPAGPYHYEVIVRDSLACYEDMRGIIDAKRDKITPLNLQLTRARSIFVRVACSDGPLSQATINAAYTTAPTKEQSEQGVKETKTVTDELLIEQQPIALPYPENTKQLTLTAWAEGWAPVTVEVAPAALEANIVLTERASPSKGILEVIVPQLPKSITADHFRMRLWAQPESTSEEQVYLGDVYSDSESAYSSPLKAGVWTIVLKESNPVFGYANGLVSGTVQVTVTGGQITRVTLPAIAEPLWKAGVDGFASDLQCEGKAISMKGAGLSGELHHVLNLEVGRNYVWPMQTYAFKDGDAEIPLELIGPSANSRKGRIYRNFASRVEVRVVRDGKPATGVFTAQGRMTDEQRCECSRQGVENEPSLHLWLPAGNAQISMYSAGICSMSRHVVIKRNESVVVEFVLNSNSLVLNWDERYSSEGGRQWLIRNEQGAFVAVAYSSVKYIELPAGRYSIAPFASIDEKTTFQFQVPASGEVTLSLPFVKQLVFEGCISLPFPQGLKPDPEGYSVHLCWFPTAYGEMSIGREAVDRVGDPFEIRFTDDCVKITGLPINMEFVFFASIANLDNESGDYLMPLSWSAAPRRMKLEDVEPQNLAGIWSQAVTMNYQWHDVAVPYKLIPASNPLGIYYDEEWSVLPAGSYVCRWRYWREEDNSPVDVETSITLVREEGKHCPIPQNLASEWKAKEIIPDYD